MVGSHFTRMAEEEEFYIKGCKVDREKLLNNFTPRPDDPENLRFMGLWKEFRQIFYTSQVKKNQKGESVRFRPGGRIRQRKLETGVDGGSLGAVLQNLYSRDLD